MNIDKTEVYGFEAAIRRGMRNPLNSWDKSDSKFFFTKVTLGNNDLDLAQRLIKGGTEHSKFLRFIIVWCDMELPLYLWKEFDTYKFVEKNSCSTMHKITSRELTYNDFEYESWSVNNQIYIDYINYLIRDYKAVEEKELKEHIFRKIVQDLPSSYLQKRTIVTNYAELRNMYKQRRNHKLNEWHKICDWIKSLPYAEELITYGLEGE